MRKAKERVIFDNYYDDENFEEIKKYCIEKHLENYPNDSEWLPSDEEVWNECSFQEEMMWDDFNYEFKKFIEECDFTFILQGYIRRWDGAYDGGFVFNSFHELSNAWRDCDYLKVYDENGRLYIKCSHHDGTNTYEIRMLNEKGYEYYNNHYDMDDRELHNKLMTSNYSKLPNYAHKVYRCKKREYEKEGK